MANKVINIFKVKISKNPQLKVDFKKELLKGVNFIQGKLVSNKIFKVIPYYARGNRRKGKMQVWNKSRDKISIREFIFIIYQKKLDRDTFFP